MKNCIILLIFFLSVFGHAQTVSSKNDTASSASKWSFKVGTNLVDNSGDESPFDGFNVKEMGFSNSIAVGFDYRFSQRWSLGLMLSNNEFQKSKSNVDGQIITKDLNYFATDLHLKYSFWSAQFEADKNFNLYLLAGFGNFKIVNNTLSNNAGFGMVYWLNDVVGIRFESMGKWVSTNKDYDSNHFQHFLGISFRLQGEKDSDKDGIADKYDACPTVFGVHALLGCPDSDNDGVADAQDACPNLAGTQFNKGCPDSDGDGVVDAEDACKNTYGAKENKGCPYIDSDQDGVFDHLDKCPKVFGVLAANGCPSNATIDGTQTDTVAEAGKIAVEKQQIKKFLKNYSKAIYFQPSKTTFSANGISMLKDIAAFLKQFPTAQILVEGHADSIGSYEFNHEIAKKRANSIKLFLIENGIPAANIEAVSYGERKPVATNMYKAGRALNRRVRIKVKE